MKNIFVAVYNDWPFAASYDKEIIDYIVDMERERVKEEERKRGTLMSEDHYDYDPSFGIFAEEVPIFDKMQK